LEDELSTLLVQIKYRTRRKSFSIYIFEIAAAERLVKGFGIVADRFDVVHGESS
jgi:hypothetical protein